VLGAHPPVSNKVFFCLISLVYSVAVALVGSSFVNEEGGESMVSKSAVGGVMSEGMLCDSRMLGWVGGAAGIAVLIDESIKIGSAPRATRLRHKQEEKNILQGDEEVKGLFEKKLTKEERKMFAEEKRNARKDERLQKRQRRMMDAEA